MLDANKDGLLSAEELLPFGELHGFEGDMRAWRQEFAAMCQVARHRSSLTQSAFRSVVDEWDHFRLTTSRLERVIPMLKVLQQQQRDAFQSKVRRTVGWYNSNALLINPLRFPDVYAALSQVSERKAMGLLHGLSRALQTVPWSRKRFDVTRLGGLHARPQGLLSLLSLHEMICRPHR